MPKNNLKQISEELEENRKQSNLSLISLIVIILIGLTTLLYVEKEFFMTWFNGIS